MKIIIGNASKELGESVVNRLDVQPSSAWISKFTDGEVSVEVANDLYNQEVY
ncbi:MAG: ribose-phosphate pyrophosphokinase-like domain-containing protein, partial [Wolbachia sp.]